MADLDRPIGAAEQTLAFALTYLVACTVTPDPDGEMMIGVLRDVRHHVDRGHPIIGPMAEAVDDLILAHGGKGVASTGTSWCSAMFHARQTVARFAKWRAGRANDQFQSKRRGAA